MNRRQWIQVSHRSILAVDDSPDALFVFARLLPRLEVSLRLQTAPGGQEAIVQLERMTASNDLPLVAFVDVRMPVMDGLTLLQWIRSRGELARLPVVLFSEEPAASDVKRAGSLGAQAFLPKGLAQSQLLAILEYAINCELHPTALKSIACTGNLLAN